MLQGGVAGAPRVVLVGDRRAEDGHDPVAGELVDGALELGRRASARIEKKRCMILRHSSGSCCSARSIEPLTSANSTVTCLRSASTSSLRYVSLTPRCYAGRRSRPPRRSLRGCAPSSSPEPRPASAGPRRCASTPPAGGSSPACAREEDADALREAGSERLAPLILDVTDAGQIAAAAERIGAAAEGGLDGLVNNAGVAIPGPLETMPIEDFRRQVEVNLIGQVAVTQAMLPAIRRARGRIVFISSIGGRIAFPLTGAYHAAKFGIEAVGDVFRQELRPWGISVSIVEPGSIDTPIWERGERETDEIGSARPRPGDALRQGDRELSARWSGRLAERGIPPEKVAAADRARAHRRAAPAPATWSASTRRSRRGSKLVIPTRSSTGSSPAMMGF